MQILDRYMINCGPIHILFEYEMTKKFGIYEQESSTKPHAYPCEKNLSCVLGYCSGVGTPQSIGRETPPKLIWLIIIQCISKINK